MIVLIQHDFLFVVTYQCNQLSHCSYDNSIICFKSVKIIYRHVIALYHQDFLLFEDSPVVAFLFLPLFFSTFSLERLSLRTAGFSVRCKHFSKLSLNTALLYVSGQSLHLLLFYYVTVLKLYYSLPYVFGIVQLAL